MLVSYNRYINRSVPESGTDLFIYRQDGLIWSQFYHYHTIGGTTTQGAGTTERWPSVTASSTHPTLMCRAVLGFRVQTKFKTCHQSLFLPRWRRPGNHGSDIAILPVHFAYGCTNLKIISNNEKVSDSLTFPYMNTKFLIE